MSSAHPTPWLYPVPDAHRLARVIASLRHVCCGVMGMGVTGRSVAALLHAHGAQLLLADERPITMPEGMAADRVQLARLPLHAHCFAGCALVVVSPGVPPDHTAVKGAFAAGALVIGELELVAALMPQHPIVGITGTNGKSTTTALLGAWLGALGCDVFVGGNLGLPMSSWPLQQVPASCAVLELSSYHIDQMHHARPKLGAVLNLAPDHLARYGSMQAYARSKARLVHAVPEDGFVVLNADDAQVQAMAAQCRAQVLYFGTQPAGPGTCGVVVDGDVATFYGELPWRSPWQLSLAHPRLLGTHNRLNAAAALLMLGALKPALMAHHKLLPAYHAFVGLAHRLCVVDEVQGVAFINDSKATNDAAAAIGIAAMRRPSVVLLGGEDKGGGYAAVRQALIAAQVRAVVCYGAARPQLRAALDTLRAAPHHLTILEADDMHLALATARTHARPGDAVLLSPACASFDGFANYVARGEAFVAWVRALGAW